MARVATVTVRAQRKRASGRWSLELAGRELRHAEPVSACMRALAAVPGLVENRAALRLVITELWTNALEHGVLRCNSSLKCSPAGFEAYYDQRRRRLQRLAAGWIRIRLAWNSRSGRGALAIEVEDSGRGFRRGWRARAVAPFGRGIALVEAHSDSLSYSRGGRRARATFLWR
jgi:hypothetical protein